MAKKTAKRAPAKAKRKKQPTTAAVSVFENLSLRNIRLVGLNADLQITGGSLPTKTEIKTTVSVGPSPDGRILVDGYVITETTPPEPGDNPSKLLLQAHYQCIYAVAEGKRLEDFAPFGKEMCFVGMHAMWPYFRELIQSISTRTGLPPVVLPVFLGSSSGSGAGANVTLVEATDD
jgi:hypothetical protein